MKTNNKQQQWERSIDSCVHTISHLMQYLEDLYEKQPAANDTQRIRALYDQLQNATTALFLHYEQYLTQQQQQRQRDERQQQFRTVGSDNTITASSSTKQINIT